MSPPSKTFSLSQCAQVLCADATRSEGSTLAVRVLVDALTPGLRYFNAAFKEILRTARNGRVSEVETQLKDHPNLKTLFCSVCADLKSAQQEEWWLSVIEVAECGAQRNVIARLIDKQIATHPPVLEMRQRWQAAHIDGGGALTLVQTLSETRSPAERTPLREITRAAITYLSVPDIDAEQRGAWLTAQRSFVESTLRQSWGEARNQLRALVKIAPKDPMVYLYWSLMKCTEGKISEAINGVCRAAEMAPDDALLKNLRDESTLWRATLAEAEPTPDPALVMATQAGEPLVHNSASRATGGDSSKDDARQRAEVSSDHSSWTLPAQMIQAIADLGPDRTLDVSVAGLMGQLYHLINVQSAHLRDAQRSYPEAHGLKLLERQLGRSRRLVERGLGVYRVNPRDELPPVTLGPGLSGFHTLSPQELAELRKAALYPPPEPHVAEAFETISPAPALPRQAEADVDLETPPPVPLNAGGGGASTEMLAQMGAAISVSITPPPESLSVPSDMALDFTLEPEITDLARAEQLMQRGEFAQAEHCLLNLLDQNPFDALVHNDLGVLYFQTQRFGDAKAHFALTIECDPNYEEGWSNLVELFASLGQLHHALPLFRRFQPLVESSPSLRRLQEICGRFAPEGIDQLPPPRYTDTAGLKLPLSGSFFISPEDDESVFDSISAPLPPEWNPRALEHFNEERERVLEERADQLRSEINALLDDYTRRSAPPQPATAKRGLISWIKSRVGLGAASAEEERQDDLNALQGEELLEELYNPLSPPPPPPQKLPEDMRRVRNIAFSMLCVPAGSFKMGTHINSPYGCANETPQHTVMITRPFQLAQVPVTQELYQAVMFRNPSHVKAPGHPVVRVSWIDAIRFCNELSDIEGLPQVYVIAQGARPEVGIRPHAAGYRLPTEAEWEYCARGRQPFRYSGSEEVQRVGWAQTDQIKTVARKDPNGWGFYDLSGNVWEWCQDGMREYTSEAQLDPSGEAHPYMHTPSARVIRGGSWCFEEDGARVAFRGRGALGLRISSLGFRLARSL